MCCGVMLLLLIICIYMYIYTYKAYDDKNSGSATCTRSLVVKASALEKPGPGFES